MKKRVVIIAVVAVLVAGFLFVPTMLVGSSENNGMPGKDGAGTASVFSVRTENAEERTLQSYIELNGDIVTEQQVSVLPDAGGKIVSLRVELGSQVRKGQLIAEVDPSRPGVSYSLSPVYAPISGTVTSTPMAVGSTVSTSTAITNISVMDKLEIELLVPEREVGQLKEGLKAEVQLEAFPGESFSATVVRVSPVVDPSSRTKKVVLHFDKNDNRINSGMFAKVKLNTRTYPDVVTIPADALVETRGSTYVYVMDGVDKVQLREVVAGVNVDDFLEIKTGVNQGDTIVTQGQQFLTDGASVRVINAARKEA